MRALLRLKGSFISWVSQYVTIAHSGAGFAVKDCEGYSVVGSFQGVEGSAPLCSIADQDLVCGTSIKLVVIARARSTEA